MTKDPKKKYWWLLLIVLPIILALITIAPSLLKGEPSAPGNNIPAIHIEQKADGVNQISEHGDNHNNVIGDINITIPVKK